MPWVKSNLVCLVTAIAMQTHAVQAQGDLLGVDEMAEAIVTMTSPVWTGPRTPAPEGVPRPSEASRAIRSPYALLAVHASDGVSDRAAREALRALERARARLDALGWPSLAADGDLGGGPGTDLYITDALDAGAHADGLVPWSYLDRATTFAVLDPRTPSSRMDACVTAAFAEALLMSADPAEARQWRRATAAWIAWELTGQFGCDDSVTRQQAEPHRSWVGGAAGDGAGGALWLAYLAARHDEAPSRFMRDVWGLARQRTWEGSELRADPDMWSAIETAIEQSGDRLLDNVEELAVLRWFVGRGTPSDRFVASLDGDAMVPVGRRMTRLPSRVVAREPLQAFGSAYVLLERIAWREAPGLRAWLRGEYGARWSFVAVQLDARSEELRRISAPHSGTAPRAYLPIELDERTSQLLFVVTSLSNQLPDADERDVYPRSFELIVDRADD